MRKSNKPMRISAVLLTLVLVTSCFVGGTFAKYTTSGIGKDSARVAKWGVVVTATGNEKAFSQHYGAGDEALETSASATVSAADKVVAPGTKGEMVAVTLKGKPEVKVEVSNTATVTLNEHWTDKDGKFYCPIKFTVKYGSTTEDVLDGIRCTDAKDLQDKLTELINKATKTYEPGTDLATTQANNKANVSVEWEWPFSPNGENDVRDTALGDKETAPTIYLEVTTTVVQVD